jgi:hypothetical protein
VSSKKKNKKMGLFENDPCANFKKGVRGVGHFFKGGGGDSF